MVDFTKLTKRSGEEYVYLEFEEPNRFFSSDRTFSHVQHEDLFDRVLTICPYTARWLNDMQGNTKRTPIFFPFNEEYTPPAMPKRFDVIYTGNLVSNSVVELVRSISKYNYRLVSGSDHALVTDKGASYTRKLELIASSKVMLVNNLLFLSRTHVRNVHKVKGWRRNEAYSQLPGNLLSLGMTSGEIIAPQLKSRVFEAAFSRSLILCRRDPFNIIERYFSPGEEFVYYEPGRLDETLQDILSDYPAYSDVIERAYARAAECYSTAAFYDAYLRD
jgi:hypothetical protein